MKTQKRERKIQRVRETVSKEAFKSSADMAE